MCGMTFGFCVFKDLCDGGGEGGDDVEPNECGAQGFHSKKKFGVGVAMIDCFPRESQVVVQLLTYLVPILRVGDSVEAAVDAVDRADEMGEVGLDVWR